MKNTLILLAVLSVFVTGCKTMRQSTIPLTAISPSEDYTTYWFKGPGIRVQIKDTANAYNFGDSITIGKK